MPGFDKAGIQLYALSYDEPEALNAFAEEHDITFTLLSDPNSEVIKNYGILNTLIPSDDHPWYGVPFPIAYVFTDDGEIRDKFSRGHLAMRVTGEWLLSMLAVGGSNPGSESAGAAADYLIDQPYETWKEPVGGGAEMRVTSLSAPLPPGLTRELYVRLIVPVDADLFDYRVEINTANVPVSGDDSDDGETSKSDTPDSLIIHDPVIDTHDDDDEDFGPSGWALITFLHNGSSVRKQPDGSRVVPVSGTAYWTANDFDYEQQFELLIPAGQINMPHYEDVQPGQMDASYHMNVLRTRRGLPPQ